MRHRDSALVIILICQLSLLSCSIETPEAPSWDIGLTLPLVDHEYDMLEIIDRISEEALAYDSTGAISFTISEEISPVTIDAGLSVEGFSESFSEVLGTIEISVPDGVSSEILLADYIGMGGLIPPLSLDAGKDFPLFQDIERAVIESGMMEISVTNRLDLPLDTLILDIDDDGSGFRIASIEFTGGLDKGETGTRMIDLSGMTVTNDLSFDAHMHTPGDSIESLNGKSLLVEAYFPGTLSVSSARAAVPGQTKVFSEEINIGGDDAIVSASIISGELRIGIFNGTGTVVLANVTVPGLILDGSPMSISAGLSPGQSQMITRSLAEYVLYPSAGVEGQQITASLTIDIPSSGEGQIDFDSTDNFLVDINISELLLSSMAGVTGPERVEIGQTDVVVDIPDGFENFSLTGAILEMDIVSAVGFPATIELLLSADNGAELTIFGTVRPGTPESPVKTLITDSNIQALLDPIPGHITITGHAMVGDGISSGTVSSGSYVSGSVSIISPLELAIGETEFESEINHTDIEAEDLSDLTDRMKEATLTTTIINHLPLEVYVTIFMSSDSLTLFDDPELTIGPIEVSIGEIGIEGLVSAARTSENVFHLTHDDLQILENERIYIGQSIWFPGTAGETVRMIQTDWITVRAYMDVILTIGEE
ncbi:MAG: hypothetical protein KOO63_02850 [Bacteroidales bacterium]|nr:hypothetical protein [Candidatus Latescibacterota bacterium]